MNEHIIEKLLEEFDLKPGFTEDQLKESYRLLVQVWHPDRFYQNPKLRQKAEEKLKDINNSYKVLSDYLKRSDIESQQEQKEAGSSEFTETPNENVEHHGEKGKGADNSQATKGWSTWKTIQISVFTIILLIVIMIIIDRFDTYTKQIEQQNTEQLTNEQKQDEHLFDDLIEKKKAKSRDKDLLDELDDLIEQRQIKSGSEKNMGETQGVNPMIIMATSMGGIKIELYQDKAPITVENFLAYVNDKFYDGTVFHRVIPGFMIQGGGFTPEMQQNATKPPIKNEANNGLKNDTGTIAMARTSVVDSATSQFFINLTNNDFLNHGNRDFGYTVFGKVVEGMDVANKIAGVKTGSHGMHRDVPLEPVVVESIRIIESVGK